MPTYALLGATGSTGSAILRCLFSQPPEKLTLNLFVRSRSKLIDRFPDLDSTTAFRVNITEGESNDQAAMRKCLDDVDVVMACIGSNSSTQGISIVQDTAATIIATLEHHRNAQGSAYHSPTVIQLRSASVNPIFRAALSWVARNASSFCFRYVYEDLEQASALLISAAADSSRLLDYIFVDPPSIHDAEGTTPTGFKLILDGKQEPVLSYADLGAAFCELAQRRDEFAGSAVGVTATGPVKETWGTLIGYMMTGAKGRVWS